MIERIKKQMVDVPYVDALGRHYSYGEFFPPELCPWTYNETMANDFLPLSKEKAIERGFRWREPDQASYREATMQIPNHIKDMPDSVLEAVLKCQECEKNYRIIKMELDLYRCFTVPIPRICFVCRDRARIHRLNPIAIYERICAKCGKGIKTSYAPDRPEIVYCEQCYNAEVV